MLSYEQITKFISALNILIEKKTPFNGSIKSFLSYLSLNGNDDILADDEWFEESFPNDIQMKKILNVKEVVEVFLSCK